MGDKITARTQYDALGGVNVATTGAPITVPGRSVQPADLSGTLTDAVKAYIAAVNNRKATAASQAAALAGGGTPRESTNTNNMYNRAMQDLSLVQARRAAEPEPQLWFQQSTPYGYRWAKTQEGIQRLGPDVSGPQVQPEDPLRAAQAKSEEWRLAQAQREGRNTPMPWGQG